MSQNRVSPVFVWFCKDSIETKGQIRFIYNKAVQNVLTNKVRNKQTNEYISMAEI